MLDMVRNKIILFYTIALLLISLSIFNISDSPEKAIISLLNIQLIVLPLVCGIFSTIYYYNSAEFIELITAQPLQRKSIFMSILTGLIISLCIASILGTAVPLLFYSASETSLLFIFSGLALTAIFTAFAWMAAVYSKEKARGIGVTLLLWFFFTLIYDGLVLFLLFRFSEYPLEKFMIGMACLNPIDLVRILILLKIDIAAIMGYTGAIFKDFFGAAAGIIFSVFILSLWFIIPSAIALRRFKRKDL